MSAPNRDWWTQSQPNPAVVPPATEFSTGAATPNPYKWPIQSANTGMGPRPPPIPSDWPWGLNGVQPPEPPVIPDTLYITSASPLPTATVGVPYSFLFQAANGVPPYRYDAPTNIVPAQGMTFPLSFSWWFFNNTTGIQPVNRQPGEIWGTPNGVSRTFDITVHDSAGATFTKTFSLPIVSATAMAFMTSGLPDGQEFEVFNSGNVFPMPVTGGNGVYGNWSATGLPNGLNFGGSGTANIGYLSGMPWPAGTYNPTFTVHDSSGATASTTLSLTINPAPTVEPLSMADVPNPLPDGYYPDQPYYFDLSPYGSGGTPPYIWGTWGTGWDVTENNVIGGTPSWAGTMDITIQMTDGTNTVTEDRTITIVDTSPPQYHRMYDGKKE